MFFRVIVNLDLPIISDVLFKDILTPAKLKWTSSCLKLMHALVFIRKSSISCVQKHDQLSWSDYVGKHAGVAVCILLGLYPWARLLKAVADVTTVWSHADWNLYTNADWSWCHQQSVLPRPCTSWGTEKKNGFTSRCEFLLSFCLENGNRGLPPGKDGAPHRPWRSPMHGQTYAHISCLRKFVYTHHT